MNADNNGRASIPEDQVNLIVEVFRMLADPTRIRVLWALTEGNSGFQPGYGTVLPLHACWREPEHRWAKFLRPGCGAILYWQSSVC